MSESRLFPVVETNDTRKSAVKRESPPKKEIRRKFYRNKCQWCEKDAEGYKNLEQTLFKKILT